MLEVLKAAADDPPPLLSHIETLRLVRRAQADGPDSPKAVDALIQHNVRLVLKTAYAYRARCTPTVALDDLVSAALIGFWNAVRLFNPGHGNRFSTYAVASMKRSIQRTLANEGLEIRLPVNRQRRLNHLNRESAQFKAANGRWPSDDELAGLTGLSREQIDYARQYPVVVTSVDDPIGDDGNGTVGDVLRVPQQPEPAIEIDRQELRDAIEQILAPRLAQVVSLRYGLSLGQDGELNERELAIKLGVSKQRIYQLLARARVELVSSPEFVRFRDLLTP